MVSTSSDSASMFRKFHIENASDAFGNLTTEIHQQRVVSVQVLTILKQSSRQISPSGPHSLHLPPNLKAAPHLSVCLSLCLSLSHLSLCEGDSRRSMKDLDFSHDKDLAKDFISNFADANGEAKYMTILQDVANHKTKAIQIDLEDLSNYKDLDEEFLNRVTENTRRYIGVFADAIDGLMPDPTEAFPDDDHDILMTQRSEEGTEIADGSDPQQKMPPEIKRVLEIYIRASLKGRPFTLWEVKASNIGQLVRISGIFTRCSDVKPLMQVAVYTCEECGFEIYQEVTARIFTPLFECPSSKCKINSTKGNLILQLRASKFLKFQLRFKS